MGQEYNIKCAVCDYSLFVREGIGMMYSPHAVFYGRRDSPVQNAFPDDFYKISKPMLHSLVQSKRIKNKAFKLLSNAAKPDNYGHELYACPKCNRLANRFYFKLDTKEDHYEPDYQCPKCKTTLCRVSLKDTGNGQNKVVYKNNHLMGWVCPDCGCDKLIYGDRFLMWD